MILLFRRTLADIISFYLILTLSLSTYLSFSFSLSLSHSFSLSLSLYITQSDLKASDGTHGITVYLTNALKALKSLVEVRAYFTDVYICTFFSQQPSSGRGGNRQLSMILNLILLALPLRLLIYNVYEE